MKNLYNLDGIKTETMKEIEYHKAALEAWQKVKFVTKKDGTTFKVLSKNIENATIYTPAYMMQPAYEQKLRVCFGTIYSGYKTDEIDLYTIARYMKNDDPRTLKTQNLQPKETYLEQIYKYDLDDIKEAVNNRIAYHKAHKEAIEKQYLTIDKAFNTFLTAYRTAIEQLALNTDKENDSSLFYNILDTVKDRYSYL